MNEDNDDEENNQVTQDVVIEEENENNEKILGDNNIKQPEEEDSIINNNEDNEDNSTLIIHKETSNEDYHEEIINNTDKEEYEENIQNIHDEKEEDNDILKNISYDENEIYLKTKGDNEELIANDNNNKTKVSSNIIEDILEKNEQIIGNSKTKISKNIEQIKEIEDLSPRNQENCTHSKEEIIHYLTGKYNHINSDLDDISFEKWVSKDNNIQSLCKEIELPLRMKFNKLLDSHDLDCEFKLLKWITQDKLHREKLISLPNELTNLNRYPHILPCIFIILIILDEFNHINFSNRKEGNDQYINASSIDGPFDSDRKLFIATQNPLLHTINHFFQLILNKKVKVIIMLSGEKEENRLKGESYLPVEKNKVKQINNNIIELIEEPIALIEKGLILRKIKISNKETIISKISHLVVSCWDEHSTPQQEIGKTLFNILFNYVNKCSPESPCLVHCLDGVGRTGAFIALYNIRKCINEQKKLNFEVPIINVFNVVRCLREQRIGMVANSVLYQYIYKIALEFNKAFYDDDDE